MTGGPRSTTWISARRQFAGADPALLRLGGRRVPLFRSIGIAGYYGALLVALLAGLRAGVHPVVVLGLSAAAAASFFGWALLRRAITGRESLVLLEHVWVAGLAVAGFCWAAGADVLRGLDVLCCGLTVFLAAGRIGCFSVGCCYGVPAAFGTTYPPGAGLPARLAGVRLLPVQLIEAAGILFIGVVALAVAGGRPGTATIWFLLSYAVVRFGTEGLRGDDRPMVAGLSGRRWMCVIQAIGAGVLAYVVLPGIDSRSLTASGFVLGATAVAGLVLTRMRRPSPLTRADALDETWSLIERLARTPGLSNQPVLDTTRDGVRVAVSLLVADGPPYDEPVDVHVSLSAPDRTQAELVAVGDALAGRAVQPGEWAVHLRLDGARLGLATIAEPARFGPDRRRMDQTPRPVTPYAEGYFGPG
ncbi:prolipoprotein diacylglyceryl transferase family protein [Kribbella pratensis]|uniref:Prolipoprotein diacylglyceryltransferase n=1 Tax=Kribbella pratensis TaxID=2512112 RepID=A0A4R8CM68_9ACTN|nr:prolipoprotein diacylglyceryl transferase family protein [Kribbella pratensis]TDW77124.1 prolipoprotein diacylglyceryltransferase [Kribbella pratensis]